MKMKFLRLAVACLFCLTGYWAQGQMNTGGELGLNSLFQDDEEDLWDEEDERGFSITLNLGAYFGNKKSAWVYNGTCGYQVDQIDGIRCWSLDERLNPDYFPNNVQNILNATGGTGLIVPSDSPPANMGYQPAFLIGLNLKYNFSRSSAVVLDFNTTRLKAVDVYTIQFIGTGQQLNGQNDTRIYTITGEEQRMFLSLGYRHAWELKGSANFYFDMFGNMLLAQMRSNYIQVPSGNNSGNSTGFVNLQLVDYNRANNAVAPGQFNPRAGVGFGFGVGPGFEFVLADKVRMDLGVIISRDKVKIESFEDNMINTQVVARFGI